MQTAIAQGHISDKNHHLIRMVGTMSIPNTPSRLTRLPQEERLIHFPRERSHSNKDKAIRHTPVNEVSAMCDSQVQASQEQIAEFKLAVKSGVYQQLYNDDLITAEDVKTLLANLAIHDQIGGERNV